MLTVLYVFILALFLLAGYVVGLSRNRDFMDQITSLRSVLSAAERERDEAAEFAHRLLESPTFWREQRSIARAVAASPDFGVFGRIVDHAREN